jgi:hypothetical protein
MTKRDRIMAAEEDEQGTQRRPKRSIEVRRAAAQVAVTASKKTGRPVDPRVKALADEADELERGPESEFPTNVSLWSKFRDFLRTRAHVGRREI